ncbi:MAG TPA: 50S ribosomal protein L9 [Firmicutes bacterium]|jgi:large subunit ribosomal protein L9|nr:50S ribosomal protein L9 [Bacillota bacterium]
MKVILIEDFSSLGQKGDLREVADGYARNFLIPRGLAVEATPGQMRAFEANREILDRKSAKEEKVAREVAEKLSGRSFAIKVKAGESGRLFGSVTTADLAEVMAKAGFKIDKRKIDLAEPIKELGEHEIQVKLHPEVRVPIQVVIETEE